MSAKRSEAAAAVVIGLTAAGVVASLRADVGHLAVMFVFIALVSMLGVWPPKRRRSISVRSDLARWLDEVSSATAEPVEHVADRALSAHRASMKDIDGG